MGFRHHRAVFVDGAVSLGQDQHGNDEIVVDDAGRQDRKKGPAKGVTGSMGPESRVEEAFLASLEHLELEIAPFAFPPAVKMGRHVAGDHIPAGHAAHVRIGKILDELQEGVRPQKGRRIGQEHDVAMGAGDGVGQHRKLPSPDGEVEQKKGGIDEFPDEGHGPVGGAVGSDQDFKLAFRVVERQGVPDLLGDHRLFVVGRDDHRHGRQNGRARLLHRTGKKTGENPDQRRINHKGVQEEEDGENEEAQEHGVTTGSRSFGPISREENRPARLPATR